MSIDLRDVRREAQATRTEHVIVRDTLTQRDHGHNPVTERIPRPRGSRPGMHRAAQRDVWDRFPAWLTVPRVGLGFVVVALALIHGVNLGGWPTFASDDEGTYYSQAWAIFHEGKLAPYTYWYDHPPLGWMQLAFFAGPLSIFGRGVPAIVVGRFVMVFYTLVSAALLYKLSRNLGLRTLAAVGAPLLWGLSPLTVFEARQIYLDNLQLPWLIAAFVLATDGRHRLHMHLLSGTVFAVAVLTKETAIFAGPAILLALWQSSYRPTRRFSVLGWLSVSGLIVLTYPLYALIKNELLSGPGHVSLVDAITWQLASRIGSGSILDSTSVANQVMQSWFAQDTFLVAAGIASAALCLFVRHVRPVGVFVVTYVAVAMRPHGYLPLMFVIIVLPFAALTIVGIIDTLVRFLARRAESTRIVGMTAVTLMAILAGVVVAPQWGNRLWIGMTVDTNSTYVEALNYVENNLSRNSVVLTDDIAWNDLVRAGWASDGFTGALWYYKLDRDPAAVVALPHGWRDVNYVLVGQRMGELIGTAALNRQSDPQVMTAYANSRVIATWGPPERRVELRQVNPGLSD